ncbi:MAG: glycosyltransferase family 9 protein [Candidatus Omnitrophota bacterium]|nr:glycosyltransferase family 9 protein [Candidatus Omnitrophota bacterium]
MLIHIDCRHYKGNKPCYFHKLNDRFCNNCREYSPIKKKILIVKLEALGDVLRTTSILPAIKNKYPHCHITWITKGDATALLEKNKFVDAIMSIEGNYLEFILNEKYDISMCLDLEPLSATINALSKACIKKGFAADKKGRVIPVNKGSRQWYWMSMNDDLKKSNRKNYFEHIYNVCGLNPPYFKPQYNLTEKQLEFADSFKINKKLEYFNKIIGVNTGGGPRWQLKRWTLNNYIETIKLLKKPYPNVGILLYGGKTEKEFNNEIINNISDLIIDTGCDNSLDEFGALINLSDIFLTPDSLGMHLSIALGKIAIVLVGPTSPWEIDLFGKGDVVYNKDLDCIGCYLASCNKDKNCMNSLSPQTIFRILEKYIINEGSNN